MIRCFIFIFIFASFSLYPFAMAPNLDKDGVVSEDVNGFMDEKLDYSKFIGRITDRDEQNNIFKVQVENNNVKFFRAGDRLLFFIDGFDNGQCTAMVQNVEDFYFTMRVGNLDTCLNSNKRKLYFTTGTLITIISEDLQDRIYQASKHRNILFLRKQDYLKQLSHINHELWAYDEIRIKTAGEFDEKILAIQQEKQQALNQLVIKKQDNIVLQKELQRKLNEIDEVLQSSRIERQERLFDRFATDHDLGLPVTNRPQKLKAIKNDQFL